MLWQAQNIVNLLFGHVVFPSEVLLFNSLTPKISWGETIVTVWLAWMSLKPLQQLAQTSLSHDPQPEDTVFNWTVIFRSKQYTNSKWQDTPTVITSDSNYKGIQLHFSRLAHGFRVGSTVTYQSNCRLPKDINMTNNQTVGNYFTSSYEWGTVGPVTLRQALLCGI